MTATEQKMNTLLKTERDVLLGGDLGALTQIAREKEAMIPNVRALDPHAHARLRFVSNQNHALLGAAMRGLRSAIRRINAISGAGAPLQTYGANGDRSALRQPRKHDLEKRS